MPYPRIHITNVRGHGIPPCPLCVFFPLRGCVFSPRTHLGGYGILPYPRRPLDNSPTDGTDAHRWFGCVGFSHGIHGIHRSFWRRIFSHGFHRCPQMVRLRRLLWEDSLVAAWVWQGCHTLLICVNLCNLWEDIPHLSFLCSVNSVGR